MRKFFWISMCRLKSHELRTTLRILHPGHTNWLHRFQILGELQQNSIKSFVKLFVAMLPLVLILRSSENASEIGFSLDQVKVSVPIGMMSLTASALFFFSIAGLQNFLVVMATKNRMIKELKTHGFSLSAFDQMNGHSEFALSLPISLNPFFKASPYIGKLPIRLYLFALFLCILPAAALLASLAYSQLELLTSDCITLYNQILAGVGLTLLGISTTYFLFVNTPFPLSRNLHFIRFGFLARISGTQLHPRAATWLGKR